MPKIKITPDKELSSEIAVRIRIDQIRRECGEALTPGAFRRIQALKARLPRVEGEALKPAIDPALLVASNCLEWGDRMHYCKA
jgi:hypothetical protein